MSQNSADSQVTSEAVLDRTTSLVILGAVLGSLFGLTVLSIFYYFCIKKDNSDKKEQDSASLYEERVNASTFAKNLGATQTIALDMEGTSGWISPQSKDDYEPSHASTRNHSHASTPDMFDCSPNRRAAETESISSSIRRVSANSSVIAPPVTKSVTPSGVYYSFSMEADRHELEGGDKEEASGGVVSNVNPRKGEDDRITEQVSMQSSPGYPRQVVTAASVYKPPKQTSMSRLVLERTISYLRRNQVEGSLTSDTYFQSSFSDTYFQSSFNNLPNHQQGIKEEHPDQLNSSSERLKHILEKDDGLEDELVKDEPIKCEDASDSVFLTEYDDLPFVKETNMNDDNSSMVSPCTGDAPTDDSAASVGELLGNANVSPCTSDDSAASVGELLGNANVSPCTSDDSAASVGQLLGNANVSPCTSDDSAASVGQLLGNATAKDYQNETWSSSSSFEALTETPEGVSKELDWDCSHEPLQTRTSVLKLVCTPKPTKSKWSKDSPIKPSDALEDSIVDGLAHEILDELEWDDETQQETKLTASFQITATHRPFSQAGKLSIMSGKSSNSSFTSAMSVSRTPFFSRLHKTSCTDYSTAEEDISNN